jgi:hypothetical protein
MKTRMRTIVLLFVGALAAACTTPDPGIEPPTEPATPEGVEDVGILETTPAQGDQLTPAGDLVVTFTAAPTSVVLTLTDSDDALIEGFASEESGGRVHRFDPTDPLSPSSSYTLTIAWEPSAEGSVELQFDTTVHGPPVDEPAALPGRAFALDFSEARVSGAPGLGYWLRDSLQGLRLLMSVTDESLLDDGVAHVSVAISDWTGETQSTCRETAGLTFGPDAQLGTEDDAPGAWSNPVISLGPGPVRLPPLRTSLGFSEYRTSPFPVHEAALRGTFDPTLGSLVDGTLTGMIDLREVWLVSYHSCGSVGRGYAVDLYGELVGGIGLETCPDAASEPACLNLTIEGVKANHVPGLVIEPVSCADIVLGFLESGTCEEEAKAYDPDGDGAYQLCP